MGYDILLGILRRRFMCSQVCTPEPPNSHPSIPLYRARVHYPLHAYCLADKGMCLPFLLFFFRQVVDRVPSLLF